MRREYVFDDGGMNLLSSSALREIREAVVSCQSSVVSDSRTTANPQPPTSLFVFRSGRPHIFAAGADMAEMQRFSAYDAYRFAQLGQELFAEIERLPCLTVALIDGDCFGGALDLVLSFDLRFATPRSRFAHPGAKLGIVTGFGGTSRWRGILDRRAAHQLFLANRILTAEEALAMNLVDRVAESDEDELRRLESVDVRMVKELTIHAGGLTRSQLLRLARLQSPAAEALHRVRE
ncbi:MAG TPA: enoyl-CoA hydratase/isomerase family protein [Thermoanaerobaculia bacterium]